MTPGFDAHGPSLATGRVVTFTGRERERAVLDSMLARVRHGESAALVLRGEAGIGKTALLQFCARRAAGCRVEQIAGVESELELPFAALHKLCEPMLSGVDRLPGPQQQALRVAFGLAEGPAPDRFVVGLAVLGLLAEAAAERPLVCLVDDALSLDEPSRQVLVFVGRRLAAEAVGLLLAVRESGSDRAFPSLPDLTVEGLTEPDARALLSAAVPGQLDAEVRDRIVAETHGNPLRLLDMALEMSRSELAGGFAVRLGSSSAALEEQYAQRVRALPISTQRLMLLAAADPTGDAALVLRAASILGLAPTAAEAATSERLFEIGTRVEFRHPAVRSAAYAAGAPEDRRAVHAALARATDAGVHADRRAWHLAAAAAEPDEAVASQLERTAVTAQARAGLAAGAAFLERAVQLTADPDRRAERAIAAAQAHMQAGAFAPALALLAEAQALAVDDVQPAKIERLRGQIQYTSNRGPDVPVLLMEAARRLEPLDLDLARETYLDAFMAALAAGPYAAPGGSLPEIAAAVQQVQPSPGPLSLNDLFLDGLVSIVTTGRPASVPTLRAALSTFVDDHRPVSDWLQWGHVATTAACAIWDWQGWQSLSVKHVGFARESGAPGPLSLGLNGLAVIRAWTGDFEAATALARECEAVRDATGLGWYPTFGELIHAAYTARPDALALMATSLEASVEQGLGIGAQWATWTMAILYNGLGRYGDAFATAQHATADAEVPFGRTWALPELVEAAVRTHQPDVAITAHEHLAINTLDESDWSAGIEARCRALISEGEAADSRYAEAVDRLARTPFRTELGRAHLLYGEWLRREGRRVDARGHLGAAHALFSDMGAEPFAERARRELLATGEKVRKRKLDPASRDELTPQETHIARLARDGRSNAEIGAELFISVRTVEWHLRKVFAKLGISARRDLVDALSARARRPSE